MNKDYWNEFIKITERKYGPVYKITEIETVLSYCWKVPTEYYEQQKNTVSALTATGYLTFSPGVRKPHEDMILKIKERIKLKGWKMTRVEKQALLESGSEYYKEYFTVLYSKEKDKISLGVFQTGYGWSFKKERLYILRRRTPLLCISKHVYVFSKQLRGYKPRIYSGKYYRSEFEPYLVQVLNCLTDTIKVHVTAKYLKENTPYTAFNSAYGTMSRELTQKISEWSPRRYVLGPESLNTLIYYGGKKTREMLNVMDFRLKECPEDLKFDDLLQESSDTVHDRYRYRFNTFEF